MNMLAIAFLAAGMALITYLGAFSWSTRRCPTEPSRENYPYKPVSCRLRTSRKSWNY